jgi:hypothetical protein
MAAQAATTSSAGAHRRSRVSIDLSSEIAADVVVLVGGRLAPVVVVPGMSIGQLSPERRPLEIAPCHQSGGHLAR